MTLHESQSTLFEYFLNEDVFNLSETKKVFITFNEEVDKQIVKLALKDLENLGIVAKLEMEDESWVLVKSLQHYEQTLNISSLTASALSQIINKYCESTGDSKNICNPVKITDSDIQNLLKIFLENREGNQFILDENDED